MSQEKVSAYRASRDRELSEQQRILRDQIGEVAVGSVRDPGPPPEPGELEKRTAEFEASLTHEQIELRGSAMEPGNAP